MKPPARAALVGGSGSGKYPQAHRVGGFSTPRVGGKMDGSLQAAVWGRLLSLPAAGRFTVGDLTNRSMGIDVIRNLLIGNVTTSLLAAVFSLFSFVLLFYYSWPLALVATALVAVLLGATTLLAFIQVRHQRELLRLQGKISSMVFGLIHGIAKLRVAGAEPRRHGGVGDGAPSPGCGRGGAGTGLRIGWCPRTWDGTSW